MLRAKDLRKNVPILQKRGFIPGPLTLLAIRVVLQHTLYGVLNPLIPQLHIELEKCLKSECLIIQHLDTQLANLSSKNSFNSLKCDK